MDKIESPRKLHSAAIPPMYRMHYNYIATLSVLYAAKFMRRDLQTIIVLWMDTVVLILFLIPSSALMCDRMIFLRFTSPKSRLPRPHTSPATATPP